MSFYGLVNPTFMTSSDQSFSNQQQIHTFDNNPLNHITSKQNQCSSICVNGFACMYVCMYVCNVCVCMM